MRIRRLLTTSAAVLGLALLASAPGRAQDDGAVKSEATDPEVEPAAMAPEEPGVSLAPPEAPPEGPAEPPAIEPPAPPIDSSQMDDAAQAIERMKAILTEVLEDLTEARDSRDMVKLNCVNEKLTSVKGLLKISEQAEVTLKEALARREAEIADHEFEKITIAQRKCEQLLAESDACIGEMAVYTGDTQVEVEEPDEEDRDESMEQDRQEQIDTDLRRPIPASPYQ